MAAQQKGFSMDNTDVLIAELEANYDIKVGVQGHLLEFAEPHRVVRRCKGESVGTDQPLKTWTFGSRRKGAVWEALKHEVFLLLCENCSKYEKEKNALKTSVAPAVAVLSSSLAS